MITICAVCRRDFADDVDGGFWSAIGKCPSCGYFLWDHPPEVLSTVEQQAMDLQTRRVFYYISLAVDVHNRWEIVPGRRMRRRRPAPLRVAL